MARKTVLVSDLSGDPIEEGSGWTMTLTPSDARKSQVRLDITDDEARSFTSKGTPQKRRGRKPKSAQA